MTKARTNADNASADIQGVTAGTGLTGGGTSGTVSLAVDTTTIQARVANVTDTEIGYLDGVSSAIQTQIDTKASTSSATLTGPIFVSPEERWTTSATTATGTINFDAVTQGALYYTSNASGNWTLNVRGDSGTTLNSILATGDTITIAFLVTNGSTAYRHTAMTIDGTSVTPKWSGGTAPAAGNASSIDAYSFTIIKTAATPTYTVLGAGPVKYA